MKAPHKHAEVIKAWAEGAQIEVRVNSHWEWKAIEVFFPHLQSPAWYDYYEYRVKPEPKPDVVETYWVEAASATWDTERRHNLKLTFSGETGKLKAAEVL
jgi:hypothetical protein